MRVFITGITGFVGSEVAARMRANGLEVGGGTSRADRVVGSVVQLSLGEHVDPAIFSGVTAVVHAAHDMRPGSQQRNVAGTLAIANAAAAAGVPLQVYISSYSAHEGAVTEYGQTKLELEPWFMVAGHAVVRPGLVVGRGGVFAQMAALFRRSPVVPVVSPGSLVPVIGAADLSQAIDAIVRQSLTGLHRLYLDQRITMMALMREIRRSAGSRTLLLPLPYSMARLAAALAESLGLAKPGRADSVRALRANQSVTGPGDLARFVPAPMGLREMVDAARVHAGPAA